ncbi:LacI family DNA-binding transcriptional regulator [Cellulomonas sp. PS-H5]|uniref:LacI family DNA-binding transcriptional regulator n=1 Tax=Cellulomonas sp. PS-H5 TaxID=2820400 RepID=UPI001C4E556F|nr:LacI family DNA-binding transcriptional regulator [Cellulomonas sp. PS-H5]MBW0255510.1 LacI family DNA-binding transcriptional regulator [Cellulomonas sp. PS-H5]
MSQRPTLADVASAAGVSVSTASLAFSGAGPIAEATKQRVLDAAADLDYAGPNPLGRQLRSGRSGIVGVVVGDALRRSFREPVSVQLLDGLVDTISPLGLGVLLVPGSLEPGAPAVDPLVESAAMDVAVLIWGGTLDDPTLQALQRRGIPLVVVEGQDLPGIVTVGIEDRAGVADIARHLVGLGHERIATVTLPFGPDRRSGLADAERLGQITWSIARRRLDGLADAGVTPVAVYETPASLVEHGHAAAQALLAGPASTRPTAVVAQSDLLASGVVLGARELGLRVPEDVSVAGFDGLDLPWLAPDVLTTVTQPITEKGAVVGRAIEALLAGGTPADEVLPVELRLGTTTGPAPTA